MKSNSTLAKNLLVIGLALLLAGFIRTAVAPADAPLSKEDVTLMLLGGSSSGKIIQIVQQRGVSFQMNPDLAKKFHDQGASDELIDALQKAGNQAAATPPSTPPPAPAAAPANPTPPPISDDSAGGKPNSPDAPQPRAEPPAAAPPPPSPAQESSPDEPVLHKRQSSSEPELIKSKDASEGNANRQDASDPKIHEIFDGLVDSSIRIVNDRKIASADLRGKVVLVNFWAPACGTCKTEIPNLVHLQDKYGWAGFQVVGIAVLDTKANVKSTATALGINYPVAMGDESDKVLYGGRDNLPVSFIVGRDGRVSQQIKGAPADPGIFEQSIQALLKPPASPSLAAANNSPASPSAAADDKDAVPAIPATASGAGLKDPSPQEIQHIIQEFAAKEKVFREARNNYTYHQINKVEEFGADNEIVGTYDQEWDILYDDAGKRIEKVTYAPLNTLKGLIITKEDIEGFRNITPFVLTTDELPDYEIKYLGHVKVDQITAYVFSTRPKSIEKNRQYFQGIVWVDDRDLQIVKSEGKQVPQDKTHHGQENLFPRFTTWREQVDGKFWFPTYTMGEDTLYFSNGPPVHMKEVIRYTDYKQFKSGSRILSVESIDKDKSTNQTTTTPSSPQK
jgi:thiol-disulfide isomerase/thioredoxin